VSWRATDAELAIARTLAADVKRRGGRVTMPVEDLLALFEVTRFTIAARQRLGEALDSARLTAEPPIRDAARSGSITIAAGKRRWLKGAKGKSSRSVYSS
jgi:hypothetical protein